jgi:heme-degrading monooxygenase HmoA
LRLLGTGAGDGFSLFPDFSTYSIICVWKHESDALNFINNSDHSKVISQKAFSRQDFFLKTIKCHGKWDGVTPFVANDRSLNEKNKIGIITRAKINKARLFEFWNSVPKASQAIKNAKGVEWCKGIGEWPFIQQATFSVWDNLESVKKFAYDKGAHSEIVRKTKKRNWYSEDLFARFEILHTELKIL